MDNPGLPDDLWSELDGGLWHATARDGLRGILSDNRIRVAFSNRYRSSFSRHLGGVSLFDFGPTSEDVPLQFNNWTGWLGHQQGTRVAVWLEINRETVLENLIDANEMRKTWRQTIDQRIAKGQRDNPNTLLIPGVEACHRGCVPLETITDVLLICRDDRSQYQRVGKPSNNTMQQIDAFESTCPALRDDPVVQLLRAGRHGRSRGT